MPHHSNHPYIKRAVRTATVGVLAAAVIGGGVSWGLSASNTDAAPANLGQHGGAARLDGDQSDTIKALINPAKAKNVILLIGDGMGDSEITSARDYEYGAAGRLPGIDALPLTGQYTTYSLKKGTTQPDYVPDSAATGTAWSTGTKSYDNAVSVDTYGVPQTSLLELAKANGLKTGVVTTSEIQDATPAVQLAHISQRSCYGPVKTSTTCASEALENGGPGSITEQMLNTRPDVTLGGGAATFNEVAKAGQYKNQTLLAQAQTRGYQLVNDKDGLAAVTKADQDAPLLGLFHAGNMDVRWKEIPATNGGADLPAARCQVNPTRNLGQPTLGAMTEKAISLLDNDKGFFLQVEGASIDKKDHSADACGQIGETIDLDEAVQEALKFAEEQGNTSVFVTADHAHTSQIVDGNTPGLSVNLLTNEGSELKISYGTAPIGGSQQHTGSQLRVAGYGPRAANVIGLTDQTDLFFTMRDALGLKTVANPVVAPQIVTGPQHTSVAEGGSATFGVTTDESVATYQWQLKQAGAANFTDLTGETSDILTLAGLTATDNGSEVRVVVTNKVGKTTSAAARVTVTLENDGRLAASSVPAVVGATRVGSTLTGSAGVWNRSDVAFTYSWLRNGKAISGAVKSTYKITAADAGATLSLRVQATKAGFKTGTALSLSTAKVAKVTPKITAAVAKKALAVTVSYSGLTSVTGTVSVFDGKTVVKTGVHLVKGKATVSLASLKKGKHNLRVAFFGNEQLNSGSKNLTVRIK